jgi:hypothetical protein
MSSSVLSHLRLFFNCNVLELCGRGCVDQRGKPELSTSNIGRLTSLPQGWEQELNALRRARNNIVHGIDTPGTQYLQELTRRVMKLNEAFKPPRKRVRLKRIRKRPSS